MLTRSKSREVSKLHVRYRKLYSKTKHRRTDYFKSKAICMQIDCPMKSLLSRRRGGETRGHPVYRAYHSHILTEDERLDLTICVPSSIRNMTGVSETVAHISGGPYIRISSHVAPREHSRCTSVGTRFQDSL